ncbi:MAG: hypothetical protein GXP48_06425 [Acidobacteria bacterium]|nr:hypothetical protein [Acidobacteriota bacterium]
MRRKAVLGTLVVAAIATIASAAGPQLRSSHAIRGVRHVKRTVNVNDVIQKLQLTYTMDQLQTGVEVGAEYCIACHQDEADWRENTHAHELRQALTQYSMKRGEGVIADYDGDGVDDFAEGLDFNKISSVFDPYKPNAPILSVENGRYFITIGQDKMPVVFTIGGNGKAAQMFVVRVPVTDAFDSLSTGNYVSPIEFDERTGRYTLYNPDAWYDPSTDLPRFDLTTDSATLASGNSSSFAEKCASCHASGVRDLHQTTSGEWTYKPYPATLVEPGDPSYFDVNHDGILDVVNVQCESCHGPGSEHILGGGDPAKIINPNDLDTQKSDELCSQCHCDSKINAPDHPAVEACPAGVHHETQADVADELSDERVGQTPDDVINGADAEDCIACHAPTAVLKNGGMNETEALDHFFTTTGGVFTADTAPDNTAQWPNVSCIVCHNQHGASTPAYFNSSTKAYEPMSSSSELCGQCHGNLRFADTDHVVYNTWAGGPHASTQADVADELSEERVGQTPNDVLHGDDAENCIACHAPTAILANGGMTETKALGYFFTTEDGAFSDSTAPAHTSDWPNVSCITCHDQHDPAHPAYFNSSTGKHEPMSSSSELCGQCHGSLRFADTDHLTYDAWKTSKHAKTQADVADELSEERVGQTPDEVINGSDAENCIACHAPTAVLANGGMSEADALSYFFTTTDGQFTADTAPANTSEWPNVSCTACHDQHDPSTPSYFNSSTGEHEAMDASELCGQCHGNLRFADTDHLSYNIEQGTGGTGVPNQVTMPGATCVDCHMYTSSVDGSTSNMLHGHSWAVAVHEPDGSDTISCTKCHSELDTIDDLNLIIDLWRDNFKALDAQAQKNVEAAATALEGVDNDTLKAKLDEARHNLTYAESDESNGFHNHLYLMSLLYDANNNATEILDALK